MHPLSVLQVTRCVVGHSQFERRTGSGPSRSQQFRDVSHLGTERARPIASNQVPIILEHRATARAVHDDVVHSGPHRVEIRSRQGSGGNNLTRVRMQRATTVGQCRAEHPITVCFQGTPSSRVNVGEQPVHDAAPKEQNGFPGRDGSSAQSPGCFRRGRGRKHPHTEPGT